MSTLYNRRRGAASHHPRKPRQCRAKIDKAFGMTPQNQCPRLAQVNRYCDGHQGERS